jgi:hypothetical protein
MRKLVFLSVISLFGILASCSNKDAVAVEKSQMVSVNVITNADADTRASNPVIPAGHELRYIMEVYETGTTNMVTRLVQDNGSFSFKLANGTYDFMFWADYIKPYPTGGNAMTYYNADNLLSVSRIVHTVSSYNVYDAFTNVDSGVVKGDEALSLSITLRRPLARINLIEKDATKLALVKSVRMEWSIGDQVFNVRTKINNGGALASPFITSNTIDGTTTNFAFDYFFAPTAKALTINTIKITFYTDDDYTNEFITRELPTAIPYQRNHQTNITANFISNQKVEYNVVIDADWDGPDFNQNITI